MIIIHCLFTDSSMSVLLIGLGGGGLPTYIHKYFPKVRRQYFCITFSIRIVILIHS